MMCPSIFSVELQNVVNCNFLKELDTLKQTICKKKISKTTKYEKLVGSKIKITQTLENYRTYLNNEDNMKSCMYKPP